MTHIVKLYTFSGQAQENDALHKHYLCAPTDVKLEIFYHVVLYCYPDLFIRPDQLEEIWLTSKVLRPYIEQNNVSMVPEKYTVESRNSKALVPVAVDRAVEVALKMSQSSISDTDLSQNSMLISDLILVLTGDDYDLDNDSISKFITKNRPWVLENINEPEKIAEKIKKFSAQKKRVREIQRDIAKRTKK